MKLLLTLPHYLVWIFTMQKLLLVVILGVFLTSCYDAEPLPERYNVDYEFALPIIDTTIMAYDFEGIRNLPESYEIEKDYPLRIGMSSYEIKFVDESLEWFELRMSFDATDFVLGSKMSLKTYIYDENIKLNFWLPENYSFTMDKKLVVIPEKPIKIEPNAALRNANTIHIESVVFLPENTKVSSLLSKKLRIKVGVKGKMKTNYKIWKKN